jgi:hypothetical protein
MFSPVVVGEVLGVPRAEGDTEGTVEGVERLIGSCVALSPPLSFFFVQAPVNARALAPADKSATSEKTGPTAP